MDIPKEFHDLYRSITDDSVFVFQKWYKYPTNELQVNFIEWYFKSTMNIEFSENRTHFRVIDFSAPPIPKYTSARFAENKNYLYVKTEEHINQQREYWAGVKERRKGITDKFGPGIENEEVPDVPKTDDLSLF